MCGIQWDRRPLKELRLFLGTCMLLFHLQRRVEGTGKREVDIREVSRDELEFLLDHALWFNALNKRLTKSCL